MDDSVLNLEIVDTDALLSELAGRFDNVLFAGSAKMLANDPTQVNIYTWTYGDILALRGLTSFVGMKINRKLNSGME